jgi:hypothetical protein
MMERLIPIYIDESSFAADIEPIYDYSKRGQVLTKLEYNYKVHRNNLVCAISRSSVLGYMLFAGPLLMEDFLFLFAKVNYQLPRYDPELFYRTR